MRLLVVTNDFPPTLGGIENYMYSIVARWKPDDVVVLTRTGMGAEEVDAGLGCRVVRQPGRVLLPTPALQRRALELIEEHHIDLVHFASPTLPLALLGARLRHATGTPYAVSVHGGEFVAGQRLSGPLMDRALRGAAVALPVSRFTQRAMLRLLADPPPTEVVHPGVDPDHFSPGTAPAFGRPDHAPVILCVCRLIARKGPATLLAALPAVLERHPRAMLVVVGRGPERARLEERARALGVLPSVRLLGPRPWGDLGAFYAAADVFALPTRERFGGLETEGFPLVYLEAAAAGLPAVAGRAGGVTEAVVDGETGLMVDGASAPETAAALLRLLGDAPLRQRMGAAARRRVLDGFTWEHTVRGFREALEKHAG